MSYQIKQSLLPDGSSPYAEWFAALDPLAAAKNEKRSVKHGTDP